MFRVVSQNLKYNETTLKDFRVKSCKDGISRVRFVTSKEACTIPCVVNEVPGATVFTDFVITNNVQRAFLYNSQKGFTRWWSTFYGHDLSSEPKNHFSIIHYKS